MACSRIAVTEGLSVALRNRQEIGAGRWRRWCWRAAAVIGMPRRGGRTARPVRRCVRRRWPWVTLMRRGTSVKRSQSGCCEARGACETPSVLTHGYFVHLGPPSPLPARQPRPDHRAATPFHEPRRLTAHRPADAPECSLKGSGRPVPRSQSLRACGRWMFESRSRLWSTGQWPMAGCDQSLGSTGSLSMARTPNTHS